jgi:hypothetical protein
MVAKSWAKNRRRKVHGKSTVQKGTSRTIPPPGLVGGFVGFDLGDAGRWAVEPDPCDAPDSRFLLAGALSSADGFVLLGF